MRLSESIMKNLKEKEETKEISNYKQEFIDYCKDKIKKLGKRKYPKYSGTYNVVMLGPDGEEWVVGEDSDGIVEFWDGDGLSLVLPPYGSEFEVVAELDFSVIDKKVYEEILEYWDDADMDFFFEEVRKERNRGE